MAQIFRTGLCFDVESHDECNFPEFANFFLGIKAEIYHTSHLDWFTARKPIFQIRSNRCPALIILFVFVFTRQRRGSADRC